MILFTGNNFKTSNFAKTIIMNIAIIGYGRMGHEIETIAVNRDHEIKLIIDQDNTDDLNELNLKETDVAIEFSLPDAAFNNIVKCLKLKTPVVSGTTGWLKDYDKAAGICKESGTSFIHSTNFSIGVNILFRLNAELARYMSHLGEYSPSIEEIHHTRKLDSPSGTAITLAGGICGQNPNYKEWCFENEKAKDHIPVRSIRTGDVPGSHIITWNSEVDSISLRHEARNRKGLALGAVIAAEFIYNRKGVFTMNDVLGF